MVLLLSQSSRANLLSNKQNKYTSSEVQMQFKLPTENNHLHLILGSSALHRHLFVNARVWCETSRVYVAICARGCDGLCVCLIYDLHIYVSKNKFVQCLRSFLSDRAIY